MNFFLLTTLETNPFKIEPFGVKRRLSKTQEFNLNLIKDESFFKIQKVDLIKIPLCFDFFGIGFSGKTSIAEHLIKSPIKANLPFEPLYK
jgi:hypothetical protein